MDFGKIISAVTSPLGFFSLAASVVTAVLGEVVVRVDVPPTAKVVFTSLLFVFAGAVVITVIVMAVKWPKNLAGIKETLERSRAIAEYIESPGFKDTIRDIVQEEIEAP
jgi:uncharacterized membrane protein